ncbi:MAG: N-acetylmuramoyl-L-alanine amidase [Flavobacteriales bacterium]|jgi:N-acetylmuramoyl-L-alanine amidase
MSKKRNISLIVIHCSATRENTDYTFEQCIRDHKARGFKGCGYHRFISKDGTIHIGRPLSQVGSHVSGSNSISIGICYEGGLDAKGKPKDTRTPAQKASILKCIEEAKAYAGASLKRITGHRDLSPDLDGDGVVEPNEWVKMCPCFNAEPEYRHLIG